MIALIAAHLPLVLSLAGGAGGLGLIVARFGVRQVLDRLDQHRELLVLAAIAAAAAFFWFQAQRARAESARINAWAQLACARAGAGYDVPGGAAATTCLGAIGDLAAFKAATVADTARVLRDHLDEQTTKTAADAVSARRDAARASAAANQLEKANAAIGPNDHVGGDWLRAFNAAAGLR